VTPDALQQLLEEVASGQLAPADALQRLRHFPSESLDFATLDHHRQLRQGQPEVVLCERKTVDQVVQICMRLAERSGRFLATRVTDSQADALRAKLPALDWHPLARVAHLAGGERPEPRGKVLVVCAGTSDLPVAEEAAVVLEAFGVGVERMVDVGVAGLHRLLGQSTKLHEADVIIVVAGMEGALPSVVAGLVRMPVIAVPTSVGYGASFQGLAALLGMLNSCAAGVTVVNIDNGFGAAAAAHRLLQRP
jgi:hypothetical protein